MKTHKFKIDWFESLILYPMVIGFIIMGILMVRVIESESKMGEHILTIIESNGQVK